MFIYLAFTFAFIFDMYFSVSIIRYSCHGNLRSWIGILNLWNVNSSYESLGNLQVMNFIFWFWFLIYTSLCSLTSDSLVLPMILFESLTGPKSIHYFFFLNYPIRFSNSGYGFISSYVLQFFLLSFFCLYFLVFHCISCSKLAAKRSPFTGRACKWQPW